MKKIMNRILAYGLLCLMWGMVDAQDTQTRSNASNGGGWLSNGGLSLFGTFGQPGVASNLVSADESLAGTVGFIGPVLNIGQNNAPVAVTNDFPDFIADSVVTLQGFDVDNDPITFEIVSGPSLGSLVQIAGEDFSFIPNAGLNPGQLYNDELTFLVNDGTEDSEVATWSFQFILEDVPQVITGLTFTGSTLGLTWSDAVPNDDYQVSIEYYDFTDAASAGFRVLLDGETYAASDISSSVSDFGIELEVSESAHPYFSSGNTILVFVLVNPSGGKGTAEAFELNTSNGRVEASEDGAFFAFGADQVVRENGEVELNLYGAELGDFSIDDAILEILTEGEKGRITTPVNVNTSNILKEWTVTYTSVEEVGGLDSIEFRVFSQSRQEFASAWAHVEIVDVNDPPTLDNIGNQVTNEDTPIQVSIDPRDPDNEISVLVESNESTLVPATYEDGVITISPSNDFSGLVSVNVIVSEVGTEENYVAYRRFDVEVIDVDDPPVVADIPDTSIDEDNALNFVVSASDVDATLAVFTYQVEVSDPSAFSIDVNGNTVRLTPTLNINGTFEVSVVADDGLGNATSVSAAEVFELTVNPVNDAPVVLRAFDTQQIIEGLPDYTINLGAFFDDVENGSDLDYSFSGNSNIDLSIEEGQLEVSPTVAFDATEEVIITASDGELEISQVLLFVPVQASGSIVVVNEIGTRTFDEDFGSETVDATSVFELTGDPSAIFDYTLTGGNFIEGMVSDQGIITFTSSDDFSGSETFYLFGAVDNLANFTSFIVEVTPVNDAPVIGVIEEQDVLEDQVLSGVFLSTSDVDNLIDDLTVQVVSDNVDLIDEEGISVSTLSNGYSFSFTPKENMNGSASINVTVSDDEFDQSVNFQINVTAVNDIPVSLGSTIADATEDVNYTFDLATGFSDVDGDALLYTLVSQPNWISIEASTITGTPSNDDVGVAPLQVRVSDGNGGTIVETYQLTVTNVNDAPVISQAFAAVDLLEYFGTSSIALSERFEDIDGDDLTYSASSDNESVVTVSVDGEDLVIAEVANGTAVISVTADDGNGGTVSTTFNVTVNNVNDDPEVVNAVVDQEFKGGFQSSEIDLSGAFTDKDVDDVLTYSAISSDENVVTVSVSGTTLTLTETGAGTATITVTASDGNGGFASFQFDFTVQPLGFQAIKDYLVYPNPTSDRLFIQGEYTELNWKLIDTSGRVLSADRLVSGGFIDVSKMNTGIYYLTIAETNKSLKVIIR
ncbi:MAG: tandem-95 repeat protein [Ekhidna sp.]|nr:tandem-95 repeat protein [Ekhidna sp.]